MEVARSAASFMDECVTVAVAEAVAVAVAVTEAVAEADQSIHDQSIHDPRCQCGWSKIQYFNMPNSKNRFSESTRQGSNLSKAEMSPDGLI